MSGRHARRPAVPLGLLAVVLVTAAAVAGVAIAMTAGDPEKSAAAERGGDSSPPVTSGSTNATGDAEPQPPAAATTTATPTPRGRLVIHGTGDVSLDPTYVSSFNSQGYEYAFSGLGGLFRRDDLTVINLECAVSELGSPLPKEFTFRCDPDALPVARRMGVDVANLGNNHSYDYGPDALVDSVRNVRRAGLAPVGAGVDRDRALAPALFELKGWTVAVVGIDMVVSFPEGIATEDSPGAAAGHDEEQMFRAIRAADRVADIVIVTIHWGIELDTEPREFQVSLGRRMVDAGADVILGHHAHRLQPMTRYRGRPIFWGLGNFVWPNLSTAGSTTAVAEVTVTPEGTFTGRLLPAFITAPGHPVLG